MAKSIKQRNGLKMKKEIFGLPWQVVILLIVALLLPLIISIAKAAPVIINYNNSITNTSIYPHVNTSQSIKFNVTANETITVWNWYLNDKTFLNNFNNYTKSWSEGGAHKIDVNGSNANGTTQTITWYVMVLRPKSNATEIHAPLNISWFDALKNSFSGTYPDFSQFFIAITLPYTYWLGDLFYIFVFGLPLIIIWLRQEKALIPATLGLIFGVLIFVFIPETWVLPAILMVTLTVFGIIYALFKERG